MHALRIGLLMLLLADSSAAEQTLLSIHTVQPPVINGVADDPVWSETTPIKTRDAIAGIDIELHACHDAENIYLLAVFPDATENRLHKPLHWNPQVELYGMGPEREDTIVLKWAISPRKTDLSLKAASPYKADIWYWKSVRTDPVGFADDKFQLYSENKTIKSLPIISKTGSRFYLLRRGDSGKSAYRNKMPVDYTGDVIDAFEISQPDGSRADIRAKGQWQAGVWRVEFTRKLNTGNGDDIAFRLGEDYRFGVSRYEIAGRAPDPSLEIPLFGSGEVGEPLLLRFAD
ncbi:MAG: ethylbenzene dehydrogenase-related protein [Candidatus Thiodiazotropha endolucinida]